MPADATLRWLVLAAGAAWVGAWISSPVLPWALVAGIAAGVVRGRSRTALACLAVGLLASGLGARALDGLAPPDPSSVDGEVTLVGDPERFGPSVRVDVRVGGRRVEAWARGPAAARLAPRLAGERVHVRGRLGPPPDDAPWLVVRHVAGRLSVDEVLGWRPGDPASRLANGLRRTVAAGTTSFDERRRPLFLGLVYGDDRGQDPLVVDAFDGAGLTHLLAVSGSNVAFVIALAGPLLVRLRLGRRLVASLAVLALFAVMTRVEPSVLRATTMAGLGAMAVTFGWDAEGRRVLPLAVVVLLLVDPLLARSLGFQLSVAASAGIIWWSGRLALAIPGPRALAAPLAVTAAAQLAVAPVLVPAFGAMPVAALPANLLAGPAAGYVVVWGLPAGVVAGLVGEPAAAWLHMPTRLLVGWIDEVARRCAALPLGQVGLAHLVVLAVVAVVVTAVRQAGGAPRRGLVVAAVLVVVVVQPVWAARVPGSREVAVAPGVTVHAAGGAVVVELDAGVRTRPLLEGLRRHRVGRIDVVVARHGGADVAEAVAVLRERAALRLVLAPQGHRVPGGSVPPVGARIGVGGFVVEVEAVSPTLDVSIRRSPGGPAVGRRAAAPRPWRSWRPP